MSDLHGCEVVSLDTKTKKKNGYTETEDLSIKGCKLISLPKICDPRGNLTFIEEERHIPFSIKRVFYLYDVPGGSDRGGHAHKNLYQFLIAISGSFDIALDDGYNKEIIHLNRSYYGLLVNRLVWSQMANFSSNSICLVMASDFYEEEDYYRDYSKFMMAVHGQS